MMKRVLQAAVVGLSVAIGGCGGGGGINLAALEQAFSQCSQGSLYHLLRLVNGTGAVVALAQGQPPPPNLDITLGPSLDPSDPPNTFDFTVSLDTDADGLFDTFLVGKATFSEDPTDGLEPGSSVDLVYEIRNAPSISGIQVETGTLTGSVDATVTFVGPQEASLTGTVVLNDSAGGCSATLVFPPGNPFQLFFPEPILGGPILEANIAGIEMFGDISVSITAIGQTLEAVLSILGGSQEVTVTGLAGTTEVGFSFDIFPEPGVIAPLAECFDQIGDLAEDVLETLGEAAGLDLADLVAGTIPGVTFTPTANPAVFDYEIDLNQFGFSGLFNATLSGQVTLTLSGLTVTRVAFTWNLLAEGGGMLTGSPATITGQNTPGRPLTINLDSAGDAVSLHGAGSFTTPACTGTFDIPSNDPVLADFSGGRADFTVGSGVNTLVLTLLLRGGGEQLTNVSVNGVPVPADLFQQYLFFTDER